jgi:hypothetical protein
VKKKDQKPLYTETIGLWGNGNGIYTSKRYRSSFCKTLGEDIQFSLCYNKQHIKDDNRPRFLMRIYNHQSAQCDYKAAELQVMMNDNIVEYQDVITLDDAVKIARGLLRDMQYGYSIDDLVVEAERFMSERSFEAISRENIEEATR